MYNIDSINSTYDIQSHTAYPNIQFIRNQTGEDMSVIAGNQLNADATIRQITDEVKRVLFEKKLRTTFDILEYLTATNKDYRYEWNRLVASVISREYNMLDEDREQSILKVLKGSSLFSIERFTYIKYDYRVGY